MKNILFILTFILSSHTMYAMVFSDWSYETNNGNTIGDTGAGTGLLTSTNKELSQLKKWYFYNEHIIGEYRPDINDDMESGYFILNEANGDLKTYNNKELFEKDVRTHELEPIFWTRWYRDHYEVIQVIWIIFVFAWPIAITLIVFIALLIFLSITLKNKIAKIVCIAITLILLLPPILLMLNDYFTSSI